MEPKAFNEFSLWLEPKGEEFKKLDSIVENLRHEARTVSFFPHVTLLANIPLPPEEIEARMVEIGTYNPFTITFSEIRVGDEYIKSLYLECDQTPELMNLNAAAQKLFSLKGTYAPHLSLMYGGSDNDIKEKARLTLKEQGIENLAIKVESISLWHAIGTADQWKRIAEIDLIGQ